jgi:hypothetical protein
VKNYDRQYVIATTNHGSNQAKPFGVDEFAAALNLQRVFYPIQVQLHFRICLNG